MRHILSVFILGLAALLAGCSATDKISQTFGGDKKDPKEMAKIHSVAGVSASSKGDYVTASREFAKAVELADVPEYYNNLGRSYFWLGRYEDALKSYAKAEELGMSNADFFANIADVFRMQNRTSDAVDYYHKAVALDARNARSHYELGNILLKQGQFTSAEERFTLVLEIDPTETRALLGRVILYRMTAQFEKAYLDMVSLDRRGFAIQNDLREEIIDGVRKQRGLPEDTPRT